MNTAQPIRNREDLTHIKDYYRVTRPNSRNYLLIIMGLNTALRVSDMITLKWKDVYDLPSGVCREHISVEEQKTGKESMIFLNDSIRSAVQEYKQFLHVSGVSVLGEDYIFGRYGRGIKHISRVQVFRIVRQAARDCGIEGVISCHSLRKTMGYHAWKQGVQPVMLMNIFNHSSFQITQRYLGIEQDDRDDIFRNIDI